MLALRQGGSHQGKTGMILVFDTILCGVMGLSWIYPWRNAILDWVTNAVGLTAGDTGKRHGESPCCQPGWPCCRAVAGPAVLTLAPCPSSWLWSSHLSELLQEREGLSVFCPLAASLPSLDRASCSLTKAKLQGADQAEFQSQMKHQEKPHVYKRERDVMASHMPHPHNQLPVYYGLWLLFRSLN